MICTTRVGGYLLLTAAIATAVLASKDNHRQHCGIVTALTVSTGNVVQQHSKHVGSDEPATTETLSAGPQLAGRSGLLHQQNKQRHEINDTHTAQLTATGVLILNSTSGDVEQVLSPLICEPLEFAEANGIDAGSSDQPIVLLVMCKTKRVLAMREFQGTFVVMPYRYRNILTNFVAITMSSNGDGTPDEESTGLAFLENDVLYHWPFLGSPIPEIVFVTSQEHNCQQATLSSLNTTHYFLLCSNKWYTVDKDAKTRLIGSRHQGSEISSSKKGAVVILSTSLQVVVHTNYLAQSCTLDVTGLLTVDFMKVDNSTFVLLFATSGVYYHNTSAGCPSFSPSLLTMTPPVCLLEQECYGYFVKEGTNLLIVTSTRSSNPDTYELEAYDMASNSSLDINFVLNQPPLLLDYKPLPPLSPSPPRLPDNITSTTTTLMPSPSESPPPSDPIKSHYIAVIVMAIIVLVLSTVLLLLVAICCVVKRRNRVKRERVSLGEDRNSGGNTEHTSLGSNEQQHSAPIQEIGGGPIEQETDLSTFRYSQPATTLSFQPSSRREERGPNQPDVRVAATE